MLKVTVLEYFGGNNVYGVISYDIVHSPLWCEIFQERRMLPKIAISALKLFQVKSVFVYSFFLLSKIIFSTYFLSSLKGAYLHRTDLLVLHSPVILFGFIEFRNGGSSRKVTLSENFSGTPGGGTGLFSGHVISMRKFFWKQKWSKELLLQIFFVVEQKRTHTYL